MRTYSKRLAEQVHRRDKWCINCGSPHNLTIAHLRNKGMGGTKRKDTCRDLVCLCILCHGIMDNGAGGKIIRDKCEEYMKFLIERGMET